MSLLVVSDLHIKGGDDPLFESLLGLIRKATGADTLVLAGDLFDLFVGGKSVFIERYGRFFDELKSAVARGVQVHYIEGNHDFQMQGAFSGIKGLALHRDEIELSFDGKRFFVAHGDQVDQGDLGYLALRYFLRTPVMKTVIAAAPGKWIDRIGNASSRRSRGTRSVVPMEGDGGAGEGDLQRIRKIYRNFAAERLLQGYDFVILGHCHDLDEMNFSIGDRQGQYINVGYPRVHDTYLVWEPGEPKVRRESFSELR